VCASPPNEFSADLNIYRKVLCSKNSGRKLRTIPHRVNLESFPPKINPSAQFILLLLAGGGSTNSTSSSLSCKSTTWISFRFSLLCSGADDASGIKGDATTSSTTTSESSSSSSSEDNSNVLGCVE